MELYPLPLADFSEWGVMLLIPVLAIVVAFLVTFILKHIKGTHTPRELETPDRR